MKNFILLFVLPLLLTTLISAQKLHIRVGEPYLFKQRITYRLYCDFAQGQPIYHADGLPDGAVLDGNKIILSKSTKSGSYILRIRVVDAVGKNAEQIITLSLGSASAEEQVENKAKIQIKESSEIDTVARRLGTIISRHSTIIERKVVQYSQNKYPSANFPTGANPNAYNPVPSNIAHSQAQKSDANRNKITSDDITLRAASERHQNSVKAITNLLQIVDQARANFHQAKKDVEIYTREHNDALSSQRQAQNKIIAAENKVSQIESAIQGLEVLIDLLRDDLGKGEALRKELTKRKAEVLETIAGEEKTKAGLIKQLEKVNEHLAGQIEQLNQQLEFCQSLEEKSQITSGRLAKLQKQFDNVVRDRKIAEADANSKRSKVNDLRKQLADAEKQLADAEIKLADIKEEEDRIPNVIAEVKKELEYKAGRSVDCRRQAKELEEEIEGLKNDDAVDLSNQISAIEASILANRKKISYLDDKLADNLAAIESLKAKLDKGIADLEFLTKQILIAKEELRILYVEGNDANTVVAHARQNLDAAVARYKKEQIIVSEATLNIEKARAEEALARLALEELIAKYSDALPYSIVPNGNGKTFAGTPYGNNPSGSPLGPVATDGNGAPGAFFIKDWTHYLSEAFGAGINPAYPGSVTELFPFNFLSEARANEVRNNYGQLRGGCGGAGPIKAFSGTVRAIREGNFDVEVKSGEKYTVAVQPCTRLSSNKNQYKLGLGNEVIVKGKLKSKTLITGTEAICLG